MSAIRVQLSAAVVAKKRGRGHGARGASTGDGMGWWLAFGLDGFDRGNNCFVCRVNWVCFVVAIIGVSQRGAAVKTVGAVMKAVGAVMRAVGAVMRVAVGAAVRVSGGVMRVADVAVRAVGVAVKAAMMERVKQASRRVVLLARWALVLLTAIASHERERDRRTMGGYVQQGWGNFVPGVL